MYIILYRYFLLLKDFFLKISFINKSVDKLSNTATSHYLLSPAQLFFLLFFFYLKKIKVDVDQALK